MKEQYLGDVNDYRKYALLRALAEGGRVKIGVCWMLTPPDGRRDGAKIDYLKQPQQWRSRDPELFDILRDVVHQPEQRRLHEIERRGTVPGAIFYDALLPDDVAGRDAYFAGATTKLRNCELVFFDPDNGFEIPSKPRGRKHSSKFLYFNEAKAFYGTGASLLVYQHFPRKQRDTYMTELTLTLKERFPASAVRLIRTPHVVFCLVQQPGHEWPDLPDRVASFVS